MTDFTITEIDQAQARVLSFMTAAVDEAVTIINRINSDRQKLMVLDVRIQAWLREYDAMDALAAKIQSGQR